MEQAIALIIVAVGGLTIFDGIHGRRLWDDLLATLRGQPLPPARTKTASTSSQSASTASSSSTLTTPTNLVTLKDIQGKPTSMQLTPDAAAAFQRAQNRIGRSIPITSGFRSLTSEAERNKQDPKRFPVPNYHTAGKAIDVWNNFGLPGWLTPPSMDLQVINALQAEGWQRFDPNGTRGEQMHWSYGGRG